MSRETEYTDTPEEFARWEYEQGLTKKPPPYAGLHWVADPENTAPRDRRCIFYFPHTISGMEHWIQFSFWSQVTPIGRSCVTHWAEFNPPSK